MFRVLRANSSSGKKGILALEALIGTILSVIALVMLVTYFNNILVQKDNITIAEENAKSIGEFIDYFTTDSNYKTQENCFNIMRLDFQTHFQYSDEGNKNFAYIISREGVFIIPFSELINLYDLIDDDNVNLNKYKQITEFDDVDLKLFYDDTDEISLNFLTNIVLATDELNLNLIELRINDFYILTPNIVTNVDKITSYVPFVPGETNNYLVRYTDGENIEELDNSNYLVYSNLNDIYKDNLLFITNSKYTLPQIRSNLCSQNTFNKLRVTDFYKNPRNILEIDYNNYDIIFKDIIENNENNINIYTFEWKNGPICKINNVLKECEDFFQLYDVGYYTDGNFDITYKDFIYAIGFFSKQNQNIDNFENWGIRSYKPTEIINKNIYFRDIFTKLDNQKYEFEKLTDSDYLFENNFFDMTQIFNNNVNGCRETECNLIQYGNKYKMYFYAGTGTLEKGIFNNKITDFDMYYFNEQILRKNISRYGNRDSSYELYYNNKKIEYETINLEQSGIDIPIFGRTEDEKFVYDILIPNVLMDNGQKKDINVFLGSIQFNNIQIYNPNEKEVIIE